MHFAAAAFVREDPVRKEDEMTRHIACLASILLSLSVATIQGQPGQEWPTYPIKKAPAALRPAIQRADLIIVSMQSATSSELTRELTAGGPGDAIQVCHLSATALTNRIAREEGVAAGRTSARLRTPSNAPKAWAAPVVKQYADTKASSVDGFVIDLGERVGVMRPIAHRAVCSPCHGLDEQLNPRVRAELKDRYPKDQATGFRDGDLRGWIWVELPKK
jgi:hypothetical protein